jgi:hypothetical protein
MLEEVIIGLVFIFAIFSAIYGSILASRLASEINYEHGFLSLWNKIQFSIVSTTTEIPEFKTEKSKQLKIRLLGLVKLSYLVIIGSVFVLFFMGASV